MPRKTTTPRDKTDGPARPARSKRPKTPRAKTAGPRSGTSPAKAAHAENDKAARKGGTSPWEWGAAAIGGAIFVGLVGFLAYAGFTRPDKPHPDIVASAGRVVRIDSGAFLVPLEVENVGHDTGANVTVRGSLRNADGALIEESSTTFDYVAQHSIVEGGLFFTADPDSGTFTLRVEGYADP